jgi:hypothetical protein
MINELKNILDKLKTEYKDKENIIENNKNIIESTPFDLDNVDYKLELGYINERLIEKNKTNKNLQISINKYISSFYKYLDTESAPTDYNDCLELTMLGDMDYNPMHPFFGDEDFYSDILNHFISTENYEKCSLIKRRRDKF